MNCLIIGAGQLGSRHLQGLLLYSKQQLKIYVVDPFQDSLDVAKSRAEEVTNTHEVAYFNSLDGTPESFEFVVIATNSVVRFKVLQELIQTKTVKYVLLEKVLFPDLKAYELAHKLLSKTLTKCFVNHSRRQHEVYHNLKKTFSASTEKIVMELLGNSWGLACNGLHFLDLFKFVGGSDLKKVDCTGFDSGVLESKRKGYIEFTGKLSAEMSNGNTCEIYSHANLPFTGITIAFTQGKKRFVIHEGSSEHVYLFPDNNKYDTEVKVIAFRHQSTLTSVTFENLIELGSSDLPSLEDASQTHTVFINDLLLHYQNITQQQEHFLPIT